MPGKRAVRQHMRSIVAPKITSAQAPSLRPGAQAPAGASDSSYLEKRSAAKRARLAAAK
jgi:hypothetical protein